MGWDSELKRADYVHRIAYRLYVGPTKPGHTIDHVRERGCLYRDCVNWWHLEQVSVRVNLSRAPRQICMKNAKKARCPQGHRYTKRNTYVTRQGWRQCKTCNSQRSAAYRQKRGV